MTDDDDLGFYEPVSLGEHCDTKYQVARILNARLSPERSPMAFRFSIGTMGSRDASRSGWRLFDWQSTPLPALCDYLERDFEGVFEIEDLQPTEIGIRNVRFGTYHLHDFSPSPGQSALSREEVEQQYPLARRNFEILVDDFRALLRRPGPYLYVLSAPADPDPAVVERLVRLLERDPVHRFRLLVVGIEGCDSDLSSIDEKITMAWRGLDTAKPAKFRWEGHDASWDKALAPFRLGFHEAGFHDPAFLRDHDPAPSASATQPDRRRGDSDRGRQRAKPPLDVRVAWRGGPGAVFSWQYWRNAGATLEYGDSGTQIRTSPTAWNYSHAVKLDLSKVDLDREDCWLRLTVADVRGRLLASLYDTDRNILSDEVPVDEGAGPTVLYFRVRDASKSQLLLRTGQLDEAAKARVLDVDLVVAEAALLGA